VGLAHVAFQVPDREAFVSMRNRLREQNSIHRPKITGISWTMRSKIPME
jgi:hypothetical protein